jgi:integrin alpha FG-GAP repeat containing protein 1
VSLGDDVGSTIALGDFTRDRYVDLVMADKAMRSLSLWTWRQREYAFRRVERAWNSTAYAVLFSLDVMPELPPSAFIAAAAPLDANADGSLDLLISVHVHPHSHVGIVLQGNGMGGLRPVTKLPDVGPDLLVMDGDGDLVADVLFTAHDGMFAFYRNSPPGTFSLVRWNPYRRGPDAAASTAAANTTLPGPEDALAEALSDCAPVEGFGSNAFVDLNGDCLPDLVVTTQNCGMHVWLNRAAATARGEDGKAVPVGRRAAFWDLSVREDAHLFAALGDEVWSLTAGDGRAVFADFNGDGTMDIAVPNSGRARVRLSLNEQRDRPFGELCTADTSWSFHSYDALRDVRLADTTLGPSLAPAAIHVGDYNYDGLMDILTVNADSGVVELFEGARLPAAARGGWRDLAPPGAPPKGTGSFWRHVQAQHHKVAFVRVAGDPVLSSLEDPVAAAFFDLDESGRQDVLVVQAHGTRLIWNNYNEVDDSEFFKATSSNAVLTASRKQRATTTSQPFVPMAGNTVKISYGGHSGHEQHICTQCPQTGFMSLQSCTCLFGIRRIANYIEEMSIGAGSVVRTWSSLMPNAMAVVWPVDGASGHWRVAYITKSRGRQMLGVVVVLASTLILLAGAIAYLHAVERVDERKQQIFLSHHFRA